MGLSKSRLHGSAALALAMQASAKCFSEMPQCPVTWLEAKPLDWGVQRKLTVFLRMVVSAALLSTGSFDVSIPGSCLALPYISGELC